MKIELTYLLINLIYLASSPLRKLDKLNALIQYFGLLFSSFYKGGGRVKIGQFSIEYHSPSDMRLLLMEIILGNEYYFKSKSEYPLIIDCGANIGVASIYFKYIYPHCRVISFEPDPDTYQILSANIKKNNLDIKTYCYGVSDNEKDAVFYSDSKKGSVINSLYRQGAKSTHKTVKLMSLVKYIKNNNIDSIDLLKINIEGEEFVLLQDLIKQNVIQIIENMIIEFHHNLPGSSNLLGEFIKMIEDSGYIIQIKTNPFPVGMVGRFQDILIYAYKKNGNNYP